jgi:hypothetical protein
MYGDNNYDYLLHLWQTETNVSNELQLPGQEESDV